MNFSPFDIDVFIIEARYTKRPHVSNNLLKRVDVASSMKDRVSLKESIPHKFSILDVK